LPEPTKKTKESKKLFETTIVPTRWPSDLPTNSLAQLRGIIVKKSF